MRAPVHEQRHGPISEGLARGLGIGLGVILVLVLFFGLFRVEVAIEPSEPIVFPTAQATWAPPSDR